MWSRHWLVFNFHHLCRSRMQIATTTAVVCVLIGQTRYVFDLQGVFLPRVEKKCGLWLTLHQLNLRLER
jgi:hypothetical protein